MKIIVGLGNPGEKYKHVRHNLGFMVVDELSVKCEVQSAKWEYQEKLKSAVFNYTLDANHYTLVKPQTYMNNSGLAVKLLSSVFSLQTSDIIVVHDELDLPLGKIKVRLGGSAAGHHGVESIINALGDDKFVRVRLGIGNLRSQSGEHKGQAFNAEKFVLEPFMPNEKSKVKHMIKQAVRTIELLLDKGLPAAQKQFN